MAFTDKTTGRNVECWKCVQSCSNMLANLA